MTRLILATGEVLRLERKCAMPLPSDMKAWIDRADYETLLERWRFTPVGSPWCQGEVGDYYKEVMFRKRDALKPGEAAQASKRIGLS